VRATGGRCVAGCELGFPASRWIRPLRRRLVLMMTGIERGIERRSMPLAELTRLLS
jgi:hypothetical protein